jgi:DNA-nicking Smr family endonuclease
MKKKEKQIQKPKEFAVSPFGALKGVALEPREQAAPPAPPPPKKPQGSRQEADDMALFFNALADVRPLHPGKAAAAKKQQTDQSAEAAEDDESLFLNAFADVSPLHPGQAAPHRAKAHAAKQQKDDEEMRVFMQAVEALRMDVRFSDQMPEQEAPQPPVNRLRQLRRGGIRIDLQLDLHGLTKDEAIENLDRFVKGAYNRGQKGVLVITGKGNNSPGEPVLKLAVAGWLKESGKTMVSEFVAAPRDMGGSGAFVVFLKEKKLPEPVASESSGS